MTLRPTLLLCPLLLAATAHGAPSSNDYCACLQSASHAPSGRYDGGLAASFIVPIHARKSAQAIRSGDWVVEKYKWTAGKAEIRYLTNDEDVRISEAAARYPFEHPGKDRCVLNLARGRALVEATHLDGREGIRVFFEEWPQPWHSLVLGIFARDRRDVCAMGAVALWSVALDADAWTNLAVVNITGDRKTFSYRNKVGMLKQAQLGDLITKSFGKVSAISDGSVSVTELEEDGSGGFREIVRELPLQRPEAPAAK